MTISTPETNSTFVIPRRVLLPHTWRPRAGEAVILVDDELFCGCGNGPGRNISFEAADRRTGAMLREGPDTGWDSTWACADCGLRIDCRRSHTLVATVLRGERDTITTWARTPDQLEDLPPELLAWTAAHTPPQDDHDMWVAITPGTVDTGALAPLAQAAFDVPAGWDWTVWYETIAPIRVNSIALARRSVRLDPDGRLICRCGNTADSHGFMPILPGRDVDWTVEAEEDTWQDSLFGCVCGVRIAIPAIRLTLTVLKGRRDEVNAQRLSLPDVPNLHEELLDWCLQHIPAGDRTIWAAVTLEGEELGEVTPIARRKILVPSFPLR